MTMDFVVIFVGSAIIGASLGCLSALLFKHVDLPGHTAAHGPKLELAVFLDPPPAKVLFFLSNKKLLETSA
eukprot:g22980.t1